MILFDTLIPGIKYTYYLIWLIIGRDDNAGTVYSPGIYRKG